jgi:hypothetical protein
MTTLIACSGCGGELDMMGMLSAHKVCWDCVKARQKTATTGMKCKCPKSKKRPFTATRKILGRTSSRVTCLRCLGAISTWT